MRCIKPVLTGISSAGISILTSNFWNSSANTCTGACRSCGGACLQPILILPVIGVLALIVGKIRRHRTS